MKKILTIVLTAVSLAGGVMAQNALATMPPSFQFKNSLVQQVNVRKAVMTADVEQLCKEDMERAKDGHPLRMTVDVPVDIEFESANAAWLSMPDGERIWQQGIRSEGASGLIVSFDELYIPEGGELFVYTADRRQVQRFDHTTNPERGYYNTTRLMYDEVTLEYVQSAVSDEVPRIKVSGVGYIYRNAKKLRDDLACFIDINCEEGADWQVQKQGVVGLWIQFEKNQWYICSGSLVNNTRQDGTPYILTAHHCIDGYTDLTFPTMEFDFFKESTETDNCHDESYESDLTRTLAGCELIADIPMNRSSDGTLLKLTKDIPADWEVYYNGWDARGEVSTTGVGIHHPNGLVKKISTYTSPLKNISNVNMGDGEYTGINTHWEVYWAETANGRSVTYGGSSGSPLFNQNGLIVGTLTGGDSDCRTPNGSDIYGKFSFHFNGYTDSKQHFKNYLDPDNTGTLVLEGYDPHAVSLDGVPEALPATEVGQNSFTANWNKMSNATAYYLDVYAAGSGEYVVKSKNVGDVSSYVVSGLQPGVRYNYAVCGGAGSSRSGYSDEIAVTTEAPSFDYYTVVALPATECSATGFTANWEAVEGASGYQLSVYEKQGGNGGTVTVDFAGQNLPDGWVSNSVGRYSSDDYSGESAPAFKMDKKGTNYLESPAFEGDIKSVSFWYRGASATEENELTVSARGKGEWETVKTIRPLNNAPGGVTVTISADELPAESTRLRFEYIKTDKGNCALDDIVVEYGEPLTVAYADGYENRSVGNVQSYRVEGLDAFGGYYYTVRATDGTLVSKEASNEIEVGQIGTGLAQPETFSTVYVSGGNIIVHRDDATTVAVSLYSLTGALLWSQPMSGRELILPVMQPVQGVYFVKVGSDTHKIILN